MIRYDNKYVDLTHYMQFIDIGCTMLLLDPFSKYLWINT